MQRLQQRTQYTGTRISPKRSAVRHRHRGPRQLRRLLLSLWPECGSRTSLYMYKRERTVVRRYAWQSRRLRRYFRLSSTRSGNGGRARAAGRLLLRQEVRRPLQEAVRGNWAGQNHRHQQQPVRPTQQVLHQQLLPRRHPRPVDVHRRRPVAGLATVARVLACPRGPSADLSTDCSHRGSGRVQDQRSSTARSRSRSRSRFQQQLRPRQIHRAGPRR